MNKITITIEDLESMLNEQKRIVGEYMTRNLTTYCWYEGTIHKIDAIKDELRKEANKSGFPIDFNILKKYNK